MAEDLRPGNGPGQAGIFKTPGDPHSPLLFELCWKQDKPGAGTACDRMGGHGGGCSWESAVTLAKARDANRRLTAALIASAHLLDVPFSNAPDLSPWTRSVKPAMAALRAALAVDPPVGPIETGSPDDDTVSDGFGSTWKRCSPACDLQVVRPGKVQCSCEGTS